MLKALLFGYIMFMVGTATQMVGTMPKCDQVYVWWLPFVIAFVLGVPAAIGYLAGSEDHEQEVRHGTKDIC